MGRSGELADLTGAWRRARAGVSSTACILGPTGIGKTRLASEFLAGAERDGAQIARARGFRGEHRIPWGSSADLIQDLLGLPGAKGISSGSDAVLRGVLPSMSRNGRDEEANNSTGEVQAAALSDAVADLIEAVGFEGPLVVLVDDWQWIDRESRALLAKVMRRIRGLPCMFLLAERTGERRLRQESAETLIGELGGRRINLGPLSETELGELLGLLAEFENPEETTAFVERIHRVTGGNPLFVGEVLRKLAEDGVYQQEEGEWVLRAGHLQDQMDLPESVQLLIRERLERLTPTAGQLAGALAAERRSVPAGQLRKRAGIDEAAFARALTELMEREVMNWAGPTEIDFTHDQLREAAGLFFHSPRKGGLLTWARERPFHAGVGALGLFLGVLLIGGPVARLVGVQLGVGGASSPPTYPFGQGQIILKGDSLVSVVPPAREGEEWTVFRSDLWQPSVPPNRTDGPYRTSNGPLRWFGEEVSVEDPPRTMEFHPDGTASVFFESSGDDGFLDLAPSGTVALLMSQNPESPSYRQNLIRVDVDEPERNPTVLYRPAEMLYGGDWSPDGQKILTVIGGLPDTLLVMTPTGTELSRFPLDEYRSVNVARWCDDSRHIVFLGSGVEPPKGVLMDTADGSRVEFGSTMLAVNQPLCLGPARGVLYQGITEESRGVFVEDFASGSRIPLFNTTAGDRWFSTWLPETAEAPVWQIDILGQGRSLDWGNSLTLETGGIRTDGSGGPTQLTWTSSDPGVASVNAEGIVTGNRVGTAIITATHAGWVSDSVAITVREASEGPREVLFRETFEDASLPKWIVSDSAFPAPLVVVREGENVLSLQGDGRYRDPMHTAQEFSLQQGATLELEFRLPLNRDDKERVIACLKGQGTSTEAEPSGASFYEREFCVLYPSAELSKRRTDLLQVTGGEGHFPYEVSASPSLPSREWVHLAMQVRPDGFYTVLVNRNEVWRFQNPFGAYTGVGWRIELAGASVDTELLIRNLTLWRGERFEIDSPGGEDPPGETGTEVGGVD